MYSYLTFSEYFGLNLCNQLTRIYFLFSNTFTRIFAYRVKNMFCFVYIQSCRNLSLYKDRPTVIIKSVSKALKLSHVTVSYCFFLFCLSYFDIQFLHNFYALYLHFSFKGTICSPLIFSCFLPIPQKESITFFNDTLYFCLQFQLDFGIFNGTKRLRLNQNSSELRLLSALKPKKTTVSEQL